MRAGLCQYETSYVTFNGLVWRFRSAQTWSRAGFNAKHGDAFPAGSVQFASCCRINGRILHDGKTVLPRINELIMELINAVAERLRFEANDRREREGARNSRSKRAIVRRSFARVAFRG